MKFSTRLFLERPEWPNTRIITGRNRKILNRTSDSTPDPHTAPVVLLIPRQAHGYPLWVYNRPALHNLGYHGTQFSTRYPNTVLGSTKVCRMIVTSRSFLKLSTAMQASVGNIVSARECQFHVCPAHSHLRSASPSQALGL